MSKSPINPHEKVPTTITRTISGKQEAALREQVLSVITSDNVEGDVQKKFLKALNEYLKVYFGKADGWLENIATEIKEKVHDEFKWAEIQGKKRELSELIFNMISSAQDEKELGCLEDFFKEETAKTDSFDLLLEVASFNDDSSENSSRLNLQRKNLSHLEEFELIVRNQMKEYEGKETADERGNVYSALNNLLMAKNSRAEALALEALEKRAEIAVEKQELIEAIFGSAMHLYREDFVQAAFEKLKKITLSAKEKGAVNSILLLINKESFCRTDLVPQIENLINSYVEGGFSLVGMSAADWQNDYLKMLQLQGDRALQVGPFLMHAAAELRIKGDRGFARYILENNAVSKIEQVARDRKFEFLVECHRDEELRKIIQNKKLLSTYELIHYAPSAIARNHDFFKDKDDEYLLSLAKIAIDSRSNSEIEAFFVGIINCAKFSDFSSFKRSVFEYAISNAVPENIEKLIEVLKFEQDNDLDKRKLLSLAIRENLIKTTSLLVKHGALIEVDANSNFQNELLPLANICSQGSVTAFKSFIRAVCEKRNWPIPGDIAKIGVASPTFSSVGSSQSSSSDSDLRSFLNQTDKKGRSALHYAAENGHDEILKLLIAAGANINLEDKEKNKAAHLAALRGASRTVEILTKNFNKDQREQFQESVEEKLEEKRKKEKGEEEKGEVKIVETPIHQAVRACNINLNESTRASFVKTWLNVQNAQGLTPLHLACTLPSGENLNKLLQLAKNKLSKEELAELIKAKSKEGKTALHYLAENGREEMIKSLLSEGADIKAKDNNGNTALHYAVNRGFAITASILLEKGGIDLATIHNKDQRSFLDFVLQHGDSTVAAEMLRYSPNVKEVMLKMVQDESRVHGATLLMRAVQGGEDDVIDFLLREKDGLGFKTKDPFFLAEAIKGGFCETIKLLLRHGFCELPEKDDLITKEARLQYKPTLEVIKAIKGLNNKSFYAEVLRSVLEEEDPTITTQATNPDNLFEKIKFGLNKVLSERQEYLQVEVDNIKDRISLYQEI